MSVSSSDKHTCKLKLFRNRIENANRKGKTDLHSTLVADRAAYKKYYAEKQFARIFSVDNTDSICTYSNKLKIIRNRIEKAKSNGQEDLHTKQSPIGWPIKNLMQKNRPSESPRQLLALMIVVLLPQMI